MRLVLAHFRAQVLELARYPAFVVPTIGLPALFFALFALPRVETADADLFMALYAAFAVLGVAFFQFGVGIASERVSPWETFLRVLPVSPLIRFAARLLTGLVFAAAAASLVVAVSVGATDAGLRAAAWLRLVLALVAGAVPFALLGIAIGYWAQPRAALPLANVLYLLLAYAGGLWTGFTHLPGAVAAISPYLPTRQWANLLAAGVGHGPVFARDVAGLALYCAVFGALALSGYRRDEGERYR